MRDPKLVPVSGGALALHHRPRRKDIARLAELGITHIVTLLAEREGAKQIGEAVHQVRLAWIWCPLANGRPPDVQMTETIRPVLAHLASLLEHPGT